MRLQFERQSNETYEVKRTKIARVVLGTNSSIEIQANKECTRATFKQFEILYDWRTIRKNGAGTYS